ncbi:MAG TPA: ferritin-like domain-containing protein [Solirubrobacteraceae bacterium]|nr:ferritin-like domain-containing protein [Solirubrobacteraceae bacterium]
MSNTINLQEIDADGAVAEAHAVAVEQLEQKAGPAGDTRLAFLRKTALAGAGAMSGGALLSALAPAALASSGGAGRPPASFGKGDVGILNYALTLEYLEAAFYNGATAANMALNSQTAAFLKVVTSDENAHVKFLKEHLGSKAAKEPKFDFKGANTSPTTFMATSQVLENTGVHAYSGQALNIKEAAYVKAALSILTVEARHASVIGLLNEPAGNQIAPNGPFDTPLTAAKVLAAVKATGFIV